MTYFGEPIDDLKIKRPSSLPEIVKDVDIAKFLEVVRNKQSHKKTIDRDSLLFLLYQLPNRLAVLFLCLIY